MSATGCREKNSMADDRSGSRSISDDAQESRLPARPADEAVLARVRGRFVESTPTSVLDAAPKLLPWWARGPPELSLEAIITLPEVSAITGLSVDSLKRHHAHLIRRLSPRRIGMKLKDAIGLGAK